MQNIFLTSNGLDTRYEKYMQSYDKIIEKLNGKKVAVIPNAKIKSQSRENSVVAMQELKKHGIDCEIFDLDENKVLELDKYNAIYFSGGEPKNIMDAVYRNNYYHKIKAFIKLDNVVVGQSAGAMIMNETYVDTTSGKVIIRNDGFDFFDKIIIPHYENLSDEIKNQLPLETFNLLDCDDLIEI